ncbi:tumor necrosis factor-inducible gene 6 protein isoform X2 [Grus americana]|uniref:tumor necrosis factor-inducible gene 6 protein isoform X2 n=1 Tax=Grus americana TaxID=9117 RepID=UPI0024079650|nr:tumor necrosis factor-inducible gene 6 protein isoform X2 [Grus americana]XP_054685521.1 tumor necrosis factor-inducible gene 6 protein isoform X2 [Grus americana]XP_054685523.1 tumor necrosis factor-inducible gene 6 protein isoform X2 [Grus americana]
MDPERAGMTHFVVQSTLLGQTGLLMMGAVRWQVPRRYHEYVTAPNQQRLSASPLQLMRNECSRATHSALSPPFTTTPKVYTAIFTTHIPERAAGVYHRESRSGKYQLTYAEAKAVCEYEGGHLATYQQLEAARKIGFHVCAAGWMAKGRVGYPIVKAGANCGFGKTGIVDYGIRLNRSERWDAYCYNPNGKECGGVFTDSKHVFKSPGYPNEYENDQICYWHIRVKYGQRIHLQFLEFDVEDDTACMADFLEIYDSYDDINGFVGRFCGDELPDDIISTGNVMTLKFLTDASVTAGGFQIRYITIDTPSKSSDGKNTTSQGKTNFLAGKFGIM